MIKHLIAILFSISTLSSCRESTSQKNYETTSPDSSFHEINAFGSIRGDTSKFVELKCGLFVNKEGIIAYKAENNSYRKRPSEKPVVVYLTTIYGADENDTLNGGQKEMRFVVDTTTFVILRSFYFKDKNHFYVFAPMSDGGTIAINTMVDKESFQILESEFYGKDKKHCYYRGEVIEGADLKSFKVLDTSFSHFIAYDKNYYYDGGERMNPNEVGEMNLDSILKKKIFVELKEKDPQL